jgi:Ca2+/Na+ antiporter
MRTVDKIRYILNILFLIGAVVTFVLFMINGDGNAFKFAGMVALTFKIMEFILRFVN